MASINFTDDPVFDAEAYAEAEEQEWREYIASTPVCMDCGKRVGEVNDYYYEIDTDVYCCEKCMTKRMRVI